MNGGELLNTLIAILGFIAVAIIACGGLYLVARIIEKLSGERQRPALTSDWAYGDVVELPAAAQVRGGRGAKAQRPARTRDEIAPHRGMGL